MDDLREKAKNVLLKNFAKSGFKYIVPSPPHYPAQWLWDSCFHAIAAAELGLSELAKNEVHALLRFQEDSGFIPHHIYHGKYRRYDFERFLYGKGLRPKSSSLVGPPVIAQAVEAINDISFTEKVLPKIVLFYRYFYEHRRGKEDGLVSIIHPRESRDSAPEFDFFRPEAPRFLRSLNKILDPLFIFLLEARYLRRGWNTKKILASNIFNVKDLMVHCIWVDGLYSLQNLLEKARKERLFPDIADIIARAEEAVFEKTWHSRDKIFYPLRVRGPKDTAMIRELAVGSLFPLLLKNIPANMREGILAYLKNPLEFWTPYPVPSVAVSHPDFNPSAAWPLWRGPTWINMNWFLVRGLLRHGYKQEARHIAEKSIEMVKDSGFREFYNPFTGQGLRVRDFGWSTLVVTFGPSGVS